MSHLWASGARKLNYLIEIISWNSYGKMQFLKDEKINHLNVTKMLNSQPLQNLVLIVYDPISLRSWKH